MDIDKIYPLIVPSGYYDKNVWALPHEPFPNKDYILTWVFFTGEISMSYITEQRFSLLNKDYANWQQQAFENLRYSGEHFHTNFRIDPHSGELSYIIFSNDDGIGSSRILLSYELKRVFLEGYYLAIPDRAFGIAISKNISAPERKSLTDLITKCYGCSGTAMSKAIMDPYDFLLPDSWTQPINQEMTDWIIRQIRRDSATVQETSKKNEAQNASGRAKGSWISRLFK